MSLKHSRGTFYELYKMPRDRSFWQYFLEITGQLETTSDGVKRLFGPSAWVPEHSNCPGLTIIIKDIVRSLPNEWRATGENIFVGRVLKGDVNAGAWRTSKAGIIEIYLQYTYVLSAYIAAFDEFALSIKSAFDIFEDDEIIEALLPDLEKRLLTPWPYLEESRPAWVDSRLLSVGSPALLQAGPLEREEGREYLVAVCEEFALTHELAHHLLGHISSRPAKGRARAAVASVIDNAQLTGKFIGENQSQRQELEADILAFIIMARAIESIPTFSNIYRALMGSIIALVALAHIKESWVEPDKEASHPDFLARSEIITGLTEWLSRGRPRGDQGDHPLGLLVQLHTFSGIAVKSWLHQQAPEKEGQASMVAVLNHVLKLAVDANAKIPNDPRFGFTA